MPAPIKVQLLSHDPQWAIAAAAESQVLAAALGETLLTVHHIGSTAIPTIRAKPILDLMPVVTDLDALDRPCADAYIASSSVRKSPGCSNRAAWPPPTPSGARDDDPAITRMMEDAWLAVHGEPLAPLPAQVVGWRLVLLRDSTEVERREFDGVHDAYAEAQDAGGAWLRQHSGDSLGAFTARATQASRRMAWDHDCRHCISQHGF